VKGLINLLLTLTARTKTESSVLPNMIIKLKEELTILPDLVRKISDWQSDFFAIKLLMDFFFPGGG